MAPGLWALQIRSWRRSPLEHRDRRDQMDKPSIAYWCDEFRPLIGFRIIGLELAVGLCLGVEQFPTRYWDDPRSFFDAQVEVDRKIVRAL